MSKNSTSFYGTRREVLMKRAEMPEERLGAKLIVLSRRIAEENAHVIRGGGREALGPDLRLGPQ